MKYVWIEESPNTASDCSVAPPKKGDGLRSRCGTTRKGEEHFPRHVQGLEWRKSGRSFAGKTVWRADGDKNPQKRYVQGSDGRTREVGRLIGVRRSWRRRRVAGKALTRPTRRRVRFNAGRKIARGRRVAALLVLVPSQKLEISSRRSFWYGRCRKNRSPGISPEISPENLPAIKGCEDIVSTLRNGSAAVNAVAIMKGKGFSLSRRSRHRLTPGTVKFAVFHVLSLEGSKGLTILELADKIQKSGLRDLTRSKAPEASISAALSRDAALFERTAPCTYCVRPTFRKDPADAEKVLSAAREKVHVFENGFLAGEDVDDVERDDDSECDVAEGPEVDDLGTPSNANKNTIHLNNGGSTCSGNGKENACNDVINPQNEVVKDFSSPLSSGTKVTTTASITLNQYGAGNPDQENVEIDESNSGEPWVQGLAEGNTLISVLRSVLMPWLP
ncbi:Homeobox-DDT domain protein RLT1 [Vitis vinifera]|uniref:Homeobox-DDT domain protein RLT1 n=1 Tax=Vitis vinifera TaxID=29760 RepID=A0A438IGE5_VITVI|nr:Homeobox-DDT domain protein RLT1 [Vitis vinifera]